MIVLRGEEVIVNIEGVTAGEGDYGCLLNFRFRIHTSDWMIKSIETKSNSNFPKRRVLSLRAILYRFPLKDQPLTKIGGISPHKST
jgi:hypothetical protein